MEKEKRRGHGCLVSCLVMFGLFVLLSAVSSIVFAGMFSASTTSLKEHSIYSLPMKGVVVERAEDDPFSGLLSEVSGREQQEEIGLEDLLANIRLAKEDKNIDGIFLNGGSLSAGYATMQELRSALIDFKQSGKFIVAYADSYSQSNYYLASVADKLYVNAHGSIEWSGLASTLTFFSRALDKLGVEMQIVKVGTFKSAVEPYILTGMSDANRLQYTKLLGDMWDEIAMAVGESRNISRERLDLYADENLTFQSEDKLVEYGLVDSLIYVQDLKAIFSSLCSTDDYSLISHNDMNNVQRKPSTGNEVAVLYAEGEIVDSGEDGIVGDKMVRQINKLAADDDVKAVVLRVNSPGGSAYASEQIWHALTLLKEKKPVVVSMGDYAASGGYYISCNASRIIAEPTTLTGSIGIFGMVPNVSGLLTDKIGVDFDGVQTHRMGQMSSNIVVKGMNEEERSRMQQMVERGYELFTGRCADGRSISQDSIKAIAEGRVWSGTEALRIGLIDQLGTIQDAIASAALMANLSDYKVKGYPEQKDWVTRMMEEMDPKSNTDIALKAFGVDSKQIQLIRQMADKPSLQARMPYFLDIK